jgi:hypothetical protein
MVLGIPPSSMAGERLFSAFSNIWTDKRNRLLVGRIRMKAYVFFITRVMKRRWGFLLIHGCLGLGSSREICALNIRGSILHQTLLHLLCN